ncbi:hypothetical protein [Pseudotamlana carrageenivorans]|nr:hypothetical protein [Tamlana carrageenivorans]
MKFSQKGIMTQRIKIVTVLFIVIICFSCKNNHVVNIQDNSNLPISYHASNVRKYYEKIKIVINKDSIKVIDTDDGNTICFGKIIEQKTTFTKYFHSAKTGEEKKNKFNDEYSLSIKDSSLLIIKNEYPNNSVKPCEFPLDEFVLIDNALLFYDDGYQLFLSEKEAKSKGLSTKIGSSESHGGLVILPFDNEELHLQNSTKNFPRPNKKKYSEISALIKLKYNEHEIDDIIQLKNELEFETYVFYVVGDSSYSSLINVKEGEIISEIEISYNVPSRNIEETFYINKNLEITIFELNNNTKESREIEKFQIKSNGVIEEIYSKSKNVDATDAQAPN